MLSVTKRDVKSQADIERFGAMVNLYAALLKLAPECRCRVVTLEIRSTLFATC